MSLPRTVAHSLRALYRDPWFSVAALLSLAIGIGASTTIFTLVESLLLRALPGVAEPQRLVNVRQRETRDLGFRSFSWPAYRDLRQMESPLVGLASFSDHLFSLARQGEPQLVVGQIVSANYFTVLGVKPWRGRFFLAAEDGLDSAPAVAVVSHALWQRRLGGDPGLVGSRILLNGIPLTVVGIAPRGFGGTFVGFVYDVWVPAGMTPLLLHRHDLAERKSRWLELVGRLRSGEPPAQAQAVIDAAQQQLARQFPEERNVSAVVSPITGFDAELRGGVIALLSILMTASLLVLLIASINVGNLVLARGVAHSQETTIRLALGAQRWRLVREALGESLALALLGGGAGVLAATWGVTLLRRLEPPAGIPLVFDFTLDAGVLAFALLLSLAAGIGVGLFPALRASRPNLIGALREGAAQAVESVRWRSGLVIAQVAFSALLLLTAGLFLRALRHAVALRPGFEPARVETVALDASVLGYDAARSQALFFQLQERLGALPGVEAAGLADKTPLGFGSLFGGQRTAIQIPGREAPPSPGGLADGASDGFKVDFNAIGPRYFAAVGIPLLRGRDLTPADSEGAPRVAIVNQTMARHFWPGADPIGRRFLHEGQPVEIVGLARDSKTVRIDEAPHDHLYLPYSQRSSPRMTFFLRTPRDPASLAAAVRQEVRAAAPSLPIVNLLTMNESIAISRLPQRVAAAVASLLGATGMLLAAVGIYGVVGYSAYRRRREIGIRMALGARRGHVMRLIVRQGLALALAGVALGNLAALALSRLLAGLLAGVSPSDPLTFAAISLLLLGAAALASFLPARAAAEEDPLIALRSG